MGGGALSSRNVSKLVGKEVRKKLRNFTLAPWGEGVRRTGEGAKIKIAQLVRDDMSIQVSDNETEKLDCHVADAPRNDNNRHHELVSGSQTVTNLTSYRPNDSMSFLNPSQPSLRKGRRIGFTLAEVLITLGIIGIVAAITIPTLIAKYQELVFKTKWKSSYSKIANAFIITRDELGISEFGEMFSSKVELNTIITEMRKNLKVKTQRYDTPCGNGADCSYGGGYMDSYKTLYGTKMNPFTFGGYYDILNKSEGTIWKAPDGATIYFRPNDFMNIFVIYVFVDVNGENSAPNILGKDMFVLVLTPKGACPIGGNCGYLPEYFKNSCTKDREFHASSLNGMHSGAPISGIGCSAEVLLK